jgi:hypothetical protein
MSDRLTGLVTKRGLMFRLYPKDRRILLDFSLRWTPAALVECWDTGHPQVPGKTSIVRKTSPGDATSLSERQTKE